ncbi:MAG TPA: DUF6448 family protein [Thermomicrobiales bacterium]|nr:DUF6448 family protein [Thermomicrobiales bacterium]
MSRAITAALLVVVAATAFVFSLSRAEPASAHCDSVNGPVVAASQAALDAGDVRLILPYVHPEAEAELTAAFNEAMTVRALGNDAQVMADRYFFETAVRLHRAGEGAPYTGLKYDAVLDPALEAADAALETGSLDAVYSVLNQALNTGVQEHYQAVIDARERESQEGTVEASRTRAEAELAFEQYLYGISQAVSGQPGHVEGGAATSAEPSTPVEGHAGEVQQ